MTTEDPIKPVSNRARKRDKEKADASAKQKQSQPPPETLAEEIFRRLIGVVSGQILVAICLAVFYAAGLFAVGLNYGVAIGFVTGIFSLLPFIGMAMGALIAVIFAFMQTNSWVLPLLVVCVFAAGQLLESYLLTPWLVGKKAGLHPVIVFFAILIGGAFFGPIGMVVALPVATLAAIFLRRYKNHADRIPPRE